MDEAPPINTRLPLQLHETPPADKWDSSHYCTNPSPSPLLDQTPYKYSLIPKIGKGPHHTCKLRHTCKLCHMSAYYVTIMCLTWSHGSQLLFRMALQSRWSDLATEWLQAGKSCEASGAVSWITLECSLLLRELRSNNTTKPLIIRAFSCSSCAWERGFAITVLHYFLHRRNGTHSHNLLFFRTYASTRISFRRQKCACLQIFFWMLAVFRDPC